LRHDPLGSRTGVTSMIPPYGRQHRLPAAPIVHRFDFAPATRPRLALLGVHPTTAWIRIEGHLLDVRFGRWRLATTLENVVSAGVRTPPPVRWRRRVEHSGTTGTLVLATGGRGGVHIRFARPIPGAGPLAGCADPALLVTVTRPDRLVADLCSGRGWGPREGEGPP
jgi:hypothetical protein